MATQKIECDQGRVGRHLDALRQLLHAIWRHQLEAGHLAVLTLRNVGDARRVKQKVDDALAGD